MQGGGDEAAAAAVEVSSLEFGYAGASASALSGFTLRLPRGARCLLVGANGAGKSTLLRVLGGRHLVPRDSVRVLGRPAFHDPNLVTSGALVYLGGAWTHDVAYAGSDIPLQGDFTAEHMLWGVPGVDPERRAQLIELLDIDLKWRMHKVSDGQRRRVQIGMSLLKPFQVLLCDEVTVDLDVVVRLDLLQFLREECEQRGATIIYATHIFDGLQGWVTHMAYVKEGHLVKGEALNDMQEAGLTGPKASLFTLVESWLRREKDEREAQGRANHSLNASAASAAPKTVMETPFMPRKHMAYYR
eukprot:jgi/Chlat1/1058/Chrsp110S01564